MLPMLAQASQCSRPSTSGNWTYTYVGTVYAPDALSAAAVGHLSQDAKGNVTGSRTQTLAGQTEAEDISGSVTVSANCTGTATINVYLSGQLLRTAVINVVYHSDGITPE